MKKNANSFQEYNCKESAPLGPHHTCEILIKDISEMAAHGIVNL